MPRSISTAQSHHCCSLHWYFAIICEPEHVLVPAASNIPSTRQQTRQSISELMITEEPSTPTASIPTSTAVLENGRYEAKLGTPSEAEVEHTLHDFQGSCSISNIEPDENIDGADGERSPSALSYLSEDTSNHVLRPLSPTASDHEGVLLRRSPSDEKMAMDFASNLLANSRNANHNNDSVPEIRSVDATSFYALPKKDKGKRKASPEPESFVMEIDEEDGDPVLSDTPKYFLLKLHSEDGGSSYFCAEHISLLLILWVRDILKPSKGCLHTSRWKPKIRRT